MTDERLDLEHYRQLAECYEGDGIKRIATPLCDEIERLVKEVEWLKKLDAEGWSNIKLLRKEKAVLCDELAAIRKAVSDWHELESPCGPCDSCGDCAECILAAYVEDLK